MGRIFHSIRPARYIMYMYKYITSPFTCVNKIDDICIPSIRFSFKATYFD